MVPHSSRVPLTASHSPWAHRGGEQKLRLTLGLVPHPAHEDLFSCCQRKNFRGAPYSFFAIHITAALVLFMTDGMTVSLPSKCTFLGDPPLQDSSLRMAREREGHQGFLETSPVVQSIPRFKLKSRERLSPESFTAPVVYIFVNSADRGL